MGSGSGPEPSGSAGALARNLGRLQSEFGTTPSGYFGSKGKSSSNQVRAIASDAPTGQATRFFSIASDGGETGSARNGSVLIARFKNGATITYRATSGSDGSPVVEIRMPSSQTRFPAYQKIHFTRRST